MKRIEDDFQTLADDVAAGRKRTFSVPESQLITRFQQLWGLRFGFQQYPARDRNLNGVLSTERTLTQVEKEKPGVKRLWIHRRHNASCAAARRYVDFHAFVIPGAGSRRPKNNLSGNYVATDRVFGPGLFSDHSNGPDISCLLSNSKPGG
jgi:hypothetical protein